MGTEKKYLSVRQAAFIGVGAMVGAGIFALLGAAGEVAGAAVWLSFLIAGFVAALQGYSFAKLGARYPSAGGLLEYVAKSTGNGHFTGIAKPSRQLPRAMYLALGIATVIYVAIALGVFGTLTVDKVISSGGTALAVAAEPALGQAGYEGERCPARALGHPL
jgi:amino acid transporter